MAYPDTLPAPSLPLSLTLSSPPTSHPHLLSLPLSHSGLGVHGSKARREPCAPETNGPSSPLLHTHTDIHIPGERDGSVTIGKQRLLVTENALHCGQGERSGGEEVLGLGSLETENGPFLPSGKLLRFIRSLGTLMPHPCQLLI